jgi:hypothetical protein
VAASSLQEEEEDEKHIHLTDVVSTEPTEKKLTNEKQETLLEGLTSRPVPGGNWNPENPLDWCKSFGSRSLKTWDRLKPLIHLKPGDEGYFEGDVSIEGVTVVRTKEEAERVLKILQKSDETMFHACDTEVMGSWQSM